MKGGENMAGGVSFDKAVMDSAAQILDDKTDNNLYKTYSELKDKIETEIGENGTKWNGKQASDFHDNFVDKQEPEFEKLHENIHNIADNIRDQATAWQNFDEQ